ncbi:MAG: hypothetical protein Q4G67_03150 [Actinomycetia bacterium]|nr:hypothetical protein [Actinomycetes bacterium]
MALDPREMVRVYRRSTGQKLPQRYPRGHLRFNPDLRVVPSDPSKARRLGLTDADPHETTPTRGPQTQPTTDDPKSGSEEKE